MSDMHWKIGLMNLNPQQIDRNSSYRSKSIKPASRYKSKIALYQNLLASNF